MVLSNMLDALNMIGYSFIKDASLWWFLAPVIILWLILEVYFGKYKKEKLGWNTSLGNAVTLTWISVESMRYLFSMHPENFWFRFTVITAIILYALLIVYLSFSHKLSAKITYLLASPTPIYFLCMITILWGHGVLTITGWVLLDLVAIYIVLMILFSIIRLIMPESEKEAIGGLELEEPELGESKLGPDLGLGKLDLGKKPGLGKEPDLGKGLKGFKL